MPEPRPLAFGVASGILLNQFHCALHGNVALQRADDFLITNRLHCAALAVRFDALRQQRFDLVYKPGLHHFIHARIDSRIHDFARLRQPVNQYMVFAFRTRAVGLLTLGSAGGFVDFKRTHDSPHVVGMQLSRRLRIHRPQHFVQPELPVGFLRDFSQPQTD